MITISEFSIDICHDPIEDEVAGHLRDWWCVSRKFFLKVAKVNGKSFRGQLRRCETISKSRSILTCKFSHCVILRIIHPFVVSIIFICQILKLISTRLWRHINGGSGIIKFPVHISPSIRITLVTIEFEFGGVFKKINIFDFIIQPNDSYCDPIIIIT